MAGAAIRDRNRKRDFFQRVLDAGARADASVAPELAEALARGVNQIWLWDDAIADSLAAKVAALPNRHAPDIAPATTGPDAAAAHEPSATERVAFDPFAFSAVVLLKRQGAKALLKQLETIESAADLQRLAEAQHLGVDRDITDVETLRRAIVAGAEQRLADRRAAAS
ncbi:MAG: hypothetical protein KDJ37_17350 [Hyphomicrobiaceae bacterium]|nr:hypothetical protein [Hyphomicrobiaceae bacterium]